ncbi:MAG: MerR family transcriptional regulator [Actinobacteria bacterium]|nr:MerR family transcriptional regulator [Actinomycetota bacterium]MSW22442.1 MerR family transcriptional regulator [Actinomycetota bacterium]MSX03915.1 MerR family transcriptional regulator [Actinomycetota bacterium]MSX61689.1 MerR family transcriptional regulator [Actinomycetota bacterium]MSX84071.1 MerR family transcriptional regulator [Actinomycetota bacterium]
MSTREPVDPNELLTVAAVARKLGVSPSTLRTWDRRYGLGPSSHNVGTHRRYSKTDLIRLTSMVRLIVAGVAPKDAALKALKLNVHGSKQAIEKVFRVPENQADLVTLLHRSAMKFNQAQIEKLIRKSIADIGVEATWLEVLSPLLIEVGEVWVRTGNGIEVEHFLSEILKKILRENTGKIDKPRNSRPVLLACVENELHSLALNALAAVLAEARIECIFLGARTPQIALNQVVIKSAPPVIFLWAQSSENVDHAYVKELPTIRPAPKVLLGGPGWKAAKGKLLSRAVITEGLAEAREQILQALAV